MLIINSDKIDEFRYSVAKMLFVKLYKEKYGEFEDVPKSNLLKIKKEERKYISLLTKPYSKNLKNVEIIIYYLRTTEQKDIENIKLKKEFEEKLRDYLYNAFYSPKDFFRNIEKDDLDVKFIKKYIFSINEFSQFKDSDIEKRVSDLINEYFPEYLMLYKYYAKESIEDDKYGKLNGNLTYSHPRAFNDPFDCYHENDEDKHLMNYFRVLCLTPNPKNILMWSHYGSNHEGYCLGYKIAKVIVDTVKKHVNKNVTLLIGKVKYSKSRSSILNESFSYSGFKFNVGEAYKKFEDWSYENEFRLMLVSKEFDDEYISINTSIYKKYCGLRNESADCKEYIKMAMADKQYSLIDNKTR